MNASIKYLEWPQNLAKWICNQLSAGSQDELRYYPGDPKYPKRKTGAQEEIVLGRTIDLIEKSEVRLKPDGDALVCQVAFGFGDGDFLEMKN